MRIKTIFVKNLFGIFNHEISLNLDEKVTIIHGPNGFGKTIILKMLSSLFQDDFNFIAATPFDEFLIYFENDKSILSINKIKNSEELESKEENEEIPKLIFELCEENKPVEKYIFSENIITIDLIEKTLPRFRRIGSDLWRDSHTDEVMTFETLIEFHGSKISRRIKGEEKPSWLKEILNSLDVHLIETQRLVSYLNSDSKGRIATQSSRPVLAVQKYSKELSRAIEKNLADYGSLSQSLDRTFPERLLERDPASSLTVDELMTQLTALEEKRTLLEETGLWDKEKDKINLRSLFEKINESNRIIMSAYIEDSNTKLKTLDNLHYKISMLTKFINERFLYKKMLISKTKEFSFETAKSEVILPQFLSSGEQHEVVLFYELLFKVHPNSLILIDEPELSLHVWWQEQFLNDLMEITENRGFDVLIATHSPDIICDRWDLTVELKGPNDEQKNKNRIKRSPSAMANDIRMKRSLDPRTILLLEGTSDMRVFEKFINPENCKLVDSNGKDNALSILKLLKESGEFKGLLAIVDSDFEYIQNSGLNLIPNLFLTDNHDIETMIISSNAFERLIEEFGETRKICAFCECLKISLLERALPIGYLRWMSYKDNLELSFNECTKNDIHEKIIDKCTLNVEINKLIQVFLDCSPEHKVKDADKLKEILESQVKDELYNPWFVCCGLDIIKIFTIGLINIFGNDRRGKKIDSEVLDGMLRLTYDYKDFQKTQLYKSISNWEILNSPYKVLSC